MEGHNQIAARRKRRRRRKNDRAPVSAHLLLDERMKEDVGVLSVDLLQDLFPGYKNPDGKKQGSSSIE
jgi:peroxin-6